MQFDDDMVPTLIDDPFFLHTCLEENISSNVGNNVFSSFDSFLKTVPPRYKYLLNDSKIVIDKIKNFYHDLKFINIKVRKYYTDYDDEIFELSYDGSVKQTKQNYLKIIGNDRDYDPTIVNGEIFVKSRERRSRDSYDDYDDSGEYEGSGQQPRKIGYSGSGTVVDYEIERIFNAKISELVDLIVSESRIKMIFIPIGYSNKGGHAVGMRLGPRDIRIYNGGDGLEYHYVQKKAADDNKKRYPQCILKFSRPDPDYLKGLIRDLLTIFRPYTNTSIKNVYERLFSLYVYQCFNNAFAIDRGAIDIFNDSTIQIVKKIFGRYVDNSCIEHSSVIYKKSESGLDNVAPALKHPEYHKIDSFRIVFSDNLNRRLTEYMARTFSPIYLDKRARFESWAQVFREINKIKSDIYQHVKENVSGLIRFKGLLLSKEPYVYRPRGERDSERDEEYDSRDRGQSRRQERSARDMTLDEITSQVIDTVIRYIVTNIDTLDDLATIDPNQYGTFASIKSKRSDIFRYYLLLVFDGEIEDHSFDADVDRYNTEHKVNFLALRKKHKDRIKQDKSYDYYDPDRRLYEKTDEEIRSMITNKYSVKSQETHVARKFFPIKINTGDMKIRIKKIISDVFLAETYSDDVIVKICDSITHIYAENIVSIVDKRSVDIPDVKMEFINNLMFNELKYVEHTRLNEFDIVFDINGHNLKSATTSKDRKEIEDMILQFVAVNPCVESLWKDKKIKSLDPDRGYLREQYSGSCAYNGILLAIADVDAEIDNMTVKNLKNDLTKKIFVEKLEQIKTGKITLTHQDRSVIDALEQMTTSEYEQTLEQIRTDPDSITINYQKQRDQMSRNAWKKYKSTQRKKILSQYTESLKMRYDEISEMIQTLRSHLPVREYPSITVEEQGSDRGHYEQQDKQNEYTSLHESLNTFQDVIDHLPQILNSKLTDDNQYTVLIIESVISITRVIDSQPLIHRLYLVLQEHLRTFSVKEDRYSRSSESAVDIMALYLCLYCLDHLLFNEYLRDSETEPEAMSRYYDDKENSLLRNLRLRGHMSDLNLEHLIHLIQKYELFYPLNKNNYYLAMIDSLKRSLPRIRSDTLAVDISISGSPDDVMSHLLDIPGFLNLLTLVTNKFCQLPQYSNNKMLKKIKRIVYDDPNIKFSERVAKYVSIRENYEDRDEAVKMSKMRNLYGLEFNDKANNWTLQLRGRTDGLYLFYFDLGKQDPTDFSVEISQRGRRDEEPNVYRIYPKSNVLIVDLRDMKFDIEGYGAGPITISCQSASYIGYGAKDTEVRSDTYKYQIKEFYAYEFNRVDNADFYDLFVPSASSSEISVYESMPLKKLDLKPIIDLTDVHRMIRSGDIDGATQRLAESMGNSQEGYGERYRSDNKPYYVLLPSHKPKFIAGSPFYLLSKDNKQVEHNLYNTVGYLTFYRRCYDELISDPLITSLKGGKYHELYEKILSFRVLLGFEKPKPSKVQVEEDKSTKKIQIIMKTESVERPKVVKVTDAPHEKVVKDRDGSESESEDDVPSHRNRRSRDKSDEMTILPSFTFTLNVSEADIKLIYQDQEPASDVHAHEADKQKEGEISGVEKDVDVVDVDAVDEVEQAEKVKQITGIQIYGFHIISSPDELTAFERSLQHSASPDDPLSAKKSLQFFKNVLSICNKIGDSFIGVKTDKGEMKEAMICIPMIKKRLDILDVNARVYPWNRIEDIKDGDMMIHIETDYHHYADKLACVRFTDNQFETMIPNPDITDKKSSDMFVQFCYCLLLNQEYKLLNMYLPVLVSIYHNGLSEYGTQLIDFILKHNYFNSPYNHYFLNKLHLMIHGEFNSEYVYNLSKRQSYYPQSYRSINPDQDIKQYDLDKELLFFKTWIGDVKEYVDKSFITREQLRDIVSRLDRLVTDNKYEYHIIDLDELLRYSSVFDYVMTELNYRKLFINLQLNILNVLRKLVDPESEHGSDEEIIGNIKYFTNPTFDHGIKPVGEDDSLIDAAIKLFEIITGKIVDEIQYKFIHDMINDEKMARCKVYELLMGRGKSYVIIPCILLTYFHNKKYQNVVECMPSHLLSQSTKVMTKFLPFMTCGYIHNINTTRNDKKSVNRIKKIMGSMISKIIITDDNSLKTHLLTKTEIKMNIKNKKDRYIDQEQDGGGYIELDNTMKGVMDLVEPIKEKLLEKRRIVVDDAQKSHEIDMRDSTIIIIDEFDMLLDPMRSDLNFPIGQYSNVDFQDVLIKIILNVTNELFTRYHTYMIRSDRTDEKLNKLIVRKIMLEMKEMKYQSLKTTIQNLYRTVVKKLNKQNKIEQFNVLRQHENRMIKKYYESDVTSGLKGGDITNPLLLYYIRESYKIYYGALALLLDKDYGWDGSSKTNPYIAIPFSAQDTPMKGSQYSDIVINIILTSITYCQKGFREIDVVQFIKYIKFVVKRWGIVRAKKELMVDEKLIEFSMIDGVDGFRLHMMHLYETDYRSYIESICTYLEKIVLIQYVKIDPDILNCSFVDIIDPNYIKNKFALSGTVNVHLPKFSYHDSTYVLRNIVKDQLTHEQIMKALRGDNMSQSVKKQGLASVMIIKQNTSVSDILDMMDRYQVLIDTGSFLRYDTNISIARKLSEKYEDYLIVFFDDQNVPNVLKNGILIEYDIKSLKHESMYKVYFDQKHTIGTDLDLPSTAKGLVTVHMMNNHTQIAQGLFRMREVNFYQRHDYLIKDDTDQILIGIMKQDESIESKLEALLYYLDKNEEMKHKTAEYKYLQQTILCLFRTLYDYDDVSYTVDIWVPSMVDDNILINYNFNYMKDQFISMMSERIKEFIASVDKQILELPQTQKIIEEINKLLRRFSNIEAGNSIHSVQKQSETIKNINYDVTREINYYYDRPEDTKIEMDNISYQNILTKVGCSDMITRAVTRVCEDLPLTLKMSEETYVKTDRDYDPYDNKPLKKEWTVRTIGILEICKQLRITISPDAVLTIYKMFRKDSNKLFYRCYNTVTKVTTLISSDDLVVMRVCFADMIDTKQITFVPVQEFTGDPVNDLIMMICFGIPTDLDIAKFKTIDAIQKNRQHIKSYYERYYMYKLESISPEFSAYLSSA